MSGRDEPSELDAIKRLKELVINFRDERDWKQFHSPKNLAAAIAVEAAELLELFRWQENPRKPEEVKGEVADIFIFLLLFADAAGIDLEEAVKEKMKLGETKYPVEKSRGNAKKYTDL